MQEDIIDFNENNYKPSIKDLIIWWEKMRIFFNLIVIGFSVYHMWEFWDYPMRGIKGESAIITDAFLFVLLMNAAYTSSWVLEVFAFYFFKASPFSKIQKWAIFSGGTLIALFCTNFYFVYEFDVLFA